MSIYTRSEPVTRNPKWMIGASVFAIVSGLFVVSCFAIAMLTNKTESQKSSLIQPENGSVGDKKKTYSREEFQKLAIGKTREQLIAIFGRPDQTDDVGNVVWYYSNRVLNPATGKLETGYIYFRGDSNVVNYVHF